MRELRRKVDSVEGSIALRDGSTRPLGADALRAAPEAALKLLSIAMPILAVALILARR